MKTKIKITTPKGQAKKTEKKLRIFLLGFKKPDKTTTNEEDDEIIWEVEGTPRKILRVQKNVYRFDNIMKMMLNNKMVKKARRKLNPGDEKELKNMLLNQTTVEIL